MPGLSSININRKRSVDTFNKNHREKRKNTAVVDFNTRIDTEELSSSINSLKTMIIQLQKRKIEVHLFEMPMDKQLQNSDRMLQIRIAIQELSSNSNVNFVPAPIDPKTYRTHRLSLSLWIIQSLYPKDRVFSVHIHFDRVRTDITYDLSVRPTEPVACP